MTTESHKEQNLLSFSIESRILKELGERLVKTPEVALLELIKNAYDADASICTVKSDSNDVITISDNGTGMTLEEFTNGWMRLGTSNKSYDRSKKYLRSITGEKGIGRFSVRFLGRKLQIRTIAIDPKSKQKSCLDVKFDWPKFDTAENLSKVEIPYNYYTVDSDTPTGTVMKITSLRVMPHKIDMKKVRSRSMNIINPLQSLFRQMNRENLKFNENYLDKDPGFILSINSDGNIDRKDSDVAKSVLSAYILKAVIRLNENNLNLKIYRKGSEEPCFSIIDKCDTHIGNLHADIRFFPNRKGTFSNLIVEGRVAKSFIRSNSGISVFDRNFRVQPYGNETDDWLLLQFDTGRRLGSPRSQIAIKHFPMSPIEKSTKSENWMLRLPKSHQLIGIVQIEGRRDNSSSKNPLEGLVATADREGFVENEAFFQLRDIVRGAVEALAYIDRKLQREEIIQKQQEVISDLKQDTLDTISEISSNSEISKDVKTKIIDSLTKSQLLVDSEEEYLKEREQQLEIMSLLGVVAGFLTHEFGIALSEIQYVQTELRNVSKNEPKLIKRADKFDQILANLKEYIKYTTLYIQGTNKLPKVRYEVKPVVEHVIEVFGRYASDRQVEIDQYIEPELLAPMVPAALYNGIVLNLYTNALKAVTAKIGNFHARIVIFAWNELQHHYLEVSDNGIGIPTPMKKRVFDPLVTTTNNTNYDPLGSGMGLGLTLVRKGVQSFGGSVKLVRPKIGGLVTSVKVRLPLNPQNMEDYHAN